MFRLPPDGTGQITRGQRPKYPHYMRQKQFFFVPNDYDRLKSRLLTSRKLNPKRQIHSDRIQNE